MSSGTVVVEWDSLGHLNIKSSLSINDSENKKMVIDKLLDAARAVNNQGTSLVLPAPNSTRVTSPNGR
jgi:hypothetical protein